MELAVALAAGAAGLLVGAWVALLWGRRAGRGRLEEARRQAEAARDEAAAAADRLAALLDALPQAVLLFDAAGRLRLANEAGDRYLRPRHGDALVEAAVHELVATAPPPAHGGPGSDVHGPPGASGVRGRTPGVRRLELAGPPRLVVDLVARRLDDGTGNVLVVVDDVTERRRLEEMRRDFVANISHELRTPVGALSLLAETIAGEDDPDVVSRLTGRLHAEAIRLARIVDELLLLSRIEGGLGEHRAVRLGDIVAGALERTASAAASRGIDVEVDVPEPDVELPGDRAQLVSALANLVDNALTYSDPGSLVVVRGGRVGGWLELAVTDHGIGIPVRDVTRIFERFYRVDRARSRRTGGTGLGLAIVRHVVTNHGGEVTVSSREGEGSTFVLRLPMASPDRSASGSAGHAAAPAGVGQT